MKSLAGIHDWRCLLWLPTIQREAWIGTAMFVIFLALLPFGTKIGLQIADVKVSGVDYRPVAGMALAGLLMATNFLRIKFLAMGDYLSDRRLLRVVLTTWGVLSGITLAFAIGMEVVPILSPLQEENFLDQIISLLLGSQIPLTFTLLASFVFKPSTNGASEVRSLVVGACAILMQLCNRHQPNRHSETEDDKRDWNRLLGFLDQIVKGAEPFALKVKCSEEAECAEKLSVNAKRLSADIGKFPRPYRNAILDLKFGDNSAKARDYFLGIGKT